MLGSQKTGSVLGAAAMGGLIFLVSFPLLFWNEGRAVTTARSLKEGASAVVTVNAAAVDAANEGKFVHFSGKAETTETLTDDQFGVSVTALRLNRHVQMYQWREYEDEVTRKRDGKSEKVIEYRYEKEWSDELIDSDQFYQYEQHQNPPSMPFNSRTVEAADVRVGAYRLPSSLVSKIYQAESLLVNLNDVPPELAKNLRADGGPAENAGGFYWAVDGSAEAPSVEPPSVEPADEEPSAPEPPTEEEVQPSTEDQPATDDPQPPAENPPADDPRAEEQPETETPAEETSAADDPVEEFASDEEGNEPQIGDLRIRFTATYPAEVSIMSQQTGESLQPYQTKAGDQLHMLSLGTVSAVEMISQAEAANTFMTWVIRIIGICCAMGGVTLVLRPLTMFTDWIPMLGDVVGFGVLLIGIAVGGATSLVTIAIAWLFYRPLLAISILVLAALLIVGAVYLLKSMSNKRSGPSTA